MAADNNGRNRRPSQKVLRSKRDPDLEYTIEPFCVGIRSTVDKNGKGPRVCHGLNFVKVIVKKGEVPANLERLRLPPTLGVRVVMAMKEEDANERMPFLKKINPWLIDSKDVSWERAKMLLKQQYTVGGDFFRTLHFLERSQEVCRSSASVLKGLWDGYFSGK